MSVLINFRIDESLKCKMDKVCKDLGITMSAAFNMFAKNLVNNKKISFSLDKKFKSGINLQGLFSNLRDDKSSLFVNEDLNSYNDELFIDNKYYINKIGNIIMLIPKDDLWAGIRDSAGNMSDDFMISREQIYDRERGTWIC